MNFWKSHKVGTPPSRHTDTRHPLLSEAESDPGEESGAGIRPLYLGDTVPIV